MNSRSTALALYRQHEGLIWFVIRQLAAVLQRAARVERDDILQWGRMGLWHACLRYRASTGVQFATYAQHAIRGQILNAANAYRTAGHPKAPRAVDHNRHVAYVGTTHNLRHLAGGTDTTAEDIDRRETVRLVRGAIDRAENRPRAVGRLLLQGLTVAEIARRLRLSDNATRYAALVVTREIKRTLAGRL